MTVRDRGASASVLLALVCTAALCAATPFRAPQSPAPLPPPRPAAATGTASVIGRAIAADTGTALRAATVTVRSLRGTWTATTDAEGRFRVADLPAGTFSLRISKPGFVQTAFGATARSAGMFELRDGQHLDRGDLPVPRGGVMAGRIIDEFGEPMVDVHVSALRAEYLQPGERRLSAAKATQTNDLGEFRLHSLPPGQYYVMASLRLLQVAAGGESPQRFIGASHGTAPTFYPGTAAAGDAQLVTVAAGETSPNVDLRLLAVPLAQLSGTVIDSRGDPAPRMAVMLNPARLDSAMLPIQANMAETDAQGRFTLPNVAPGEYRLDVESMARMEAIGQTGSTPRFGADGHEFASDPLTVAGADLSGIVIRTGRGFQVAGRVTVEGATISGDALKRIRIDVHPLLAGQGVSAVLQSRGALVQADGTFSATGVTGRRLIRVNGLPAGHVLQTVRALGADVTDGGFEVQQDVPGVEIVITARATQLTGTVIDTSGAPIREYMVAIFPADSRRWAARMNRYLKAVSPAANGGFSVSGLPAGEYLAVAVDALEGGEWAEPENLERLRALATRFALADGEQRALTLTRSGR